MMLNQVGEVASSKSAIHTRAPELSAPMVIFRVGGPVISQRRSASPGASGATRHAGLRGCLPFRAESRNGSLWSRRRRTGQQFGPPAGELAVKPADEVQRTLGENLFEAVVHVPTTLSRLVSGPRGTCKGWCRYCGEVVTAVQQ